MAYISEAELESWMMDRLEAVGITGAHGSAVAPGLGATAARVAYRDAILEPRLRDAIGRLNPGIDDRSLDEVVRRAQDREFPDLIQENRRLHRMMLDGVKLDVVEDNEERGSVIRLVDWDGGDNDWLAVNQFEIVGSERRYPDITIFLNGMPVVVVSLKGVEGHDLAAALNQLDEYKETVPDLYRTHALSVISDGITARFGSISAPLDRFMEWRTVDGENLVSAGTELALATLIDGLLRPDVLLQMIRQFTVFEDEGKGPIKKIAGYHQFHAGLKGVAAVRRAVEGDGRAGVMWHTQGSGKSLLMAFTGGALMHDPALANPTLVVLTDRNDLDSQLFATFARCAALFGENPVQVEKVSQLKDELSRVIGGVVFTTIQKFKPDQGEIEIDELTDRKNVVVFVDEAHRSQYGFDAKLDRKTGKIAYGFAHQLRKALPNATFVGFTGTPIDLVGADTRAVFGDYIDIYDIAQAVEDGATVPIYYQPRVVKVDLELTSEEIDAAVDEIAEGEDQIVSAAGRKWATVAGLVGAPQRLDTVASDILEHFDDRLEAMDGKAMIVAMRREIAVALYDRIIQARPDWHADQDAKGAVKVVITGNSSDPDFLRPHIRSKTRQEGLRNRFRDPDDPLKLVIVCDMWLTGFDAPCMHTLYVDKPMQGHGLMQAITRVNRTFANKPAGLVVDYIGLMAPLKKALKHYSSGDQGQTGIDERDAEDALRTSLGVVRDMFHDFDYQKTLTSGPAERLAILPGAIEHVLSMGDATGNADARKAARKRYADAVASLIRTLKLVSASPYAASFKEEVGFFAAVQAAIQKMHGGSAGRTDRETDFAISQLIRGAVGSTEVIDVLEAAGMDRPDIGVLSEDFLQELQDMPQRNLAIEALRRLLNGEIQGRLRTNVVKRESFAARLEAAMAAYHNRSVDGLQVMQEMIAMAKELMAQEADGLSPEERAFYDALSENESAVELMENEKLRLLATELVETVRRNTGVDWWRRIDVRAALRREIKKLLRDRGYPPVYTAQAVESIIKQAEALAAEVDQQERRRA